MNDIRERFKRQDIRAMMEFLLFDIPPRAGPRPGPVSEEIDVLVKYEILCFNGFVDSVALAPLVEFIQMKTIPN